MSEPSDAPPPEPHDVRAHLHGGVPQVEVTSLSHFWQNYDGLGRDAFVPRDDIYLDFAPEIANQRDIADFVATHSSTIASHQQFMHTIAAWWQDNLPTVKALAPDAASQAGRSRNVYLMRSSLLKSIEQALSTQQLLTPFQVRGAFANYVDLRKADFKSIAASGWGAELIPDAEIVQSQFPEVLEEIAQSQTRLAELQALFAAADEEDFEDSDETRVMGSEQVKSLKASLKDAKGQARLCKRDPNLGDWTKHQHQAESIELQLQRHKVLEDEVRSLRATIKAIEGKRDELVQSARAKISVDQAREVILDRLRQTLLDIYQAYLRADQRDCVRSIENLWGKYAVTAKKIEIDRDEAAEQLQAFLVELGYE